jgi:hypothetical protein
MFEKSLFPTGKGGLVLMFLLILMPYRQGKVFYVGLKPDFVEFIYPRPKGRGN